MYFSVQYSPPWSLIYASRESSIVGTRTVERYRPRAPITKDNQYSYFILSPFFTRGLTYHPTNFYFRGHVGARVYHFEKIFNGDPCHGYILLLLHRESNPIVPPDLANLYASCRLATATILCPSMIGSYHSSED